MTQVPGIPISFVLRVGGSRPDLKLETKEEIKSAEFETWNKTQFLIDTVCDSRTHSSSLGLSVLFSGTRSLPEGYMTLSWRHQVERCFHSLKYNFIFPRKIYQKFYLFPTRHTSLEIEVPRNTEQVVIANSWSWILSRTVYYPCVIYKHII